MQSLNVSLENCYGIQEFDDTFDFDSFNANIIYAPNGVMKTSLAKTFQRLAQEKEPEELLYGNTPAYDIKADGIDVTSNDILVVEPFAPEFESKNLSTLLVNNEKKIRYDQIFKEILNAKKKLITQLNKVSKIKKDDIEEQITKDLNVNDIFEAISELKTKQQANNVFSKLQYNKVFDPKILSLIASEDIKQELENYTLRYNELIESSSLFKKNCFNPIKAQSVLNTLKKESFFDADHKVLFNGKGEPISSLDELEATLEQERNHILGDGSLKAISEKILNGAAPIKSFQDTLEQFPELSAELNDIDNFKITLWCSYYEDNQEIFDQFLTLFEQNKADLEAIEQEADSEKTLWHEAATVFKERFHVNFSIDVENKVNAILGTSAPNIVFSFKNNNGEDIKFDRGQLTSRDFLSVGERRAMYLLYVIFEFKAREASGEQSIIVVDDIADSFDYKNKYAIIEYLKELTAIDSFNLLVLTHNFDFYRTFQSRILGERNKRLHSFIAQKEGNRIKLLGGGDNFITNPFDYWKRQFGNSDPIVVSMIPFIRNLVEYKDGNTSDTYLNLTSLLHIKENSNQFNLQQLQEMFNTTVNGLELNQETNRAMSVIEFIYSTADNVVIALAENSDEIRLENKVALSIAIRLKAESFMWEYVQNKTPIRGMQTGKLYDRICSENTENVNFSSTKAILDQVVLMTPENIHLNSFMFEPLMDMSNHHLISLYQNVNALEWIEND